MHALIVNITPILEQVTENDPKAIVVIEGLAELIGSSVDQALTDMLKIARRNGHFVIGESETTAWGSSWPLVGEIRNSRRGVILQPDSDDGDVLFKVTFPRMKRADFPPGRGVYVDNGKFRIVQLPMPDNLTG